MICYIRVTQVMELPLDTDSMNTILGFIGAAYGEHPDLNGHSGGMILLGKVAAASKSIRCSIHSRSSTKSQIIGVENHMPGVLWTLRFLGR